MLARHLRNAFALLMLLTLAQPERVGAKKVISSQEFSDYGSVQGRVVDELGRSVSGAKVYAEPVNAEGAPMGKLLFVTTNQNGDFTLDQLQSGKNVICASKEEAFYPDTGAAALTTNLNASPRVRIEKGKLTSGIIVQITKGGKLVGSILDSLSGQPVKNSRIRLTRVDDPRLYISTGPDEQAHFEFVVPSKPFRLEVTASGYKTWKSDDNGGSQIVAQPQSIKEFNIRLQKISGAAQE